ncbi:MAG: FAD-binding protein, partial [Clostridia bacterium]|nr:FAD-binding protein [Clostridia bacterium]
MKNRILAFMTALCMLLCLVPSAFAAATETTVATGTATAQGFGGEVTVTVTLADGEITMVEIVGDAETQGIGSKIVDEWPQAFVEANGIVDTYTGATFASITRGAVIEAAQKALLAAGVNPDDYMREMAAETAEDQTIDCDIVIVGAGGAGMVAAITAADAGKNVVILESQPAVGGNSVKSTGGMNAA